MFLIQNKPSYPLLYVNYISHLMFPLSTTGLDHEESSRHSHLKSSEFKVISKTRLIPGKYKGQKQCLVGSGHWDCSELKSHLCLYQDAQNPSSLWEDGTLEPFFLSDGKFDFRAGNTFGNNLFYDLGVEIYHPLCLSFPGPLIQP